MICRWWASTIFSSERKEIDLLSHLSISVERAYQKETNHTWASVGCCTSQVSGQRPWFKPCSITVPEFKIGITRPTNHFSLNTTFEIISPCELATNKLHWENYPPGKFPRHSQSGNSSFHVGLILTNRWSFIAHLPPVFIIDSGLGLIDVEKKLGKEIPETKVHYFDLKLEKRDSAFFTADPRSYTW